MCNIMFHSWNFINCSYVYNVQILHCHFKRQTTHNGEKLSWILGIHYLWYHTFLVMSNVTYKSARSLLNNIFPIIHLIFLACHSLLLNVSNDHFRTIWFCWLKVIIETTWGDSDMMSLHRGHFPNVYFNFCIFLNKWNLFVFLSNVNVCRGNLHRCLTFFNLSLLYHTDTINENFRRIKTLIILPSTI